MPATTPKAEHWEKKRKEDAAWVPPKYVNLSLTVAQRETLVAFKEGVSAEKVLEWINVKAQQGYTVSVKKAEEGYMTSVSGGKETPNAGLCLTARASSAENSIIAAMFRDDLLLENIWKSALKPDFDI